VGEIKAKYDTQERRKEGKGASAHAEFFKG
jgi:hypothetical protein